MEKRRNIKGKELTKLIKECKFEPNSNYLITTVNVFESESGIELVSDETPDIDTWQYVVAAGPTARYKAGDKICLNLQKLIKRIPNPTNKMEIIEQLAIVPFPLNGELLTVIDDNSVLGKEL